MTSAILVKCMQLCLPCTVCFLKIISYNCFRSSQLFTTPTNLQSVSNITPLYLFVYPSRGRNAIDQLRKTCVGRDMQGTNLSSTNSFHASGRCESGRRMTAFFEFCAYAISLASLVIDILITIKLLEFAKSTL